ncbi:O-antigen ligase family protein [Paenarthrobacter nitroguajacolicus]|uniref:O-antigen ligase family protein n=1 Tax=Paenarthrobacter nitroguajacolicus TaxID=211146 RepID=UPI0040539A3F
MWGEKLKTGALMIAGLAFIGVAVLNPQVLLIFPALAVVYAMTKSWFRLLFFVVGAFLVFQTGDGLTPTKLAYLAGVVVAAVAAIHSLIKSPDKEWLSRVRPALIGAGILAFWILVPTLIQAVMVNGTPIAMWARDALTYLLISAGVVIGVDSSRVISLKWARRITVGVGLLAAYGFASVWIQRRGIVEPVGTSEVQGSLLGSMVALTLPLALCLTLGLAQKRINILWLLLAPVFLLAVLVTGTRTGFVLTVVLIGVLGLASKNRVRLSRAFLGAALGVAALAVALPFAGAAFSDEAFVQKRLDMMVRTVENGFGSDASGIIRQRATSYSLNIFYDSPIMGQGLGKYFPNPNPGGVAENFTLDTWAIYPAKFGFLGMFVLVASLILVFVGLTRRGGGPWLYENTAVRGATLATVALLPFGAPTEDKGFAVAVALAALLICAATRPNADLGIAEKADLPAVAAKARTRSRT